ncbi:MFS transporter small subunit [Cryobacterium frigoriphilum]
MKTLKITLAWALVGVPLAYGIVQTLTRVTALFG